jgi:hypothetical protein
MQFPTLDHPELFLNDPGNMNFVHPHMFGHQLASKKSFRIRGEKEKDMMRKNAAAQSSKDLGETNNGK